MSDAPPGGHGMPDSTRNKSLFASFSSEKEESSFSVEKEAKRLLCPIFGLEDPRPSQKHAGASER
jgi:hypothetical protein